MSSNVSTIYTEFVQPLYDKKDEIQNLSNELLKAKLALTDRLMEQLEVGIEIDTIEVDDYMNIILRLDIYVEGVLLVPELNHPLSFEHDIKITKGMVEREYKNLTPKTEDLV